METDPTLPSTEDVIRKTEQITKNIQELLRAAQESKHERSKSKDKRAFLIILTLVFTTLFHFKPPFLYSHISSMVFVGYIHSYSTSFASVLRWYFVIAISPKSSV